MTNTTNDRDNSRYALNRARTHLEAVLPRLINPGGDHAVRGVVNALRDYLQKEQTYTEKLEAAVAALEAKS